MHKISAYELGLKDYQVEINSWYGYVCGGEAFILPLPTVGGFSPTAQVFMMVPIQILATFDFIQFFFPQEQSN